MKGIVRAAKIANDKSRACASCPIKDNHKVCPPEFMGVCRNAFIEGFTKGANYYKEHLWHTSDKTPKKDQPLLLHLSNGMLVFGKFEGWGYSFSVPEENLLDKIEVIKWMYINDIL